MFLAEKNSTKEKVAVKIVDRMMLQDAHYHQQEKDIFRKVEHPNIVKLYEIIEDNDAKMDYFIM